MNDDGPHWRRRPNGLQYMPITRKGWKQLWIYVGAILVMTVAFVAWISSNPGEASVIFAACVFAVAVVVSFAGFLWVILRSL